MRLQNVLKHWGCWSVGDESITANLPNVRHLGATEHPFLSNARGPELAVDGNKNGFGEMYLSQTVSISSESIEAKERASQMKALQLRSPLL